MTITLTVEEIRAYQERMKEWHEARADFIAEAYVTRRYPTGEVARTAPCPKTVETWEAENPYPKLIPSV